jgi:hypothetical protein
MLATDMQNRKHNSNVPGTCKYKFSMILWRKNYTLKRSSCGIGPVDILDKVEIMQLCNQMPNTLGRTVAAQKQAPIILSKKM